MRMATIANSSLFENDIHKCAATQSAAQHLGPRSKMSDVSLSQLNVKTVVVAVREQISSWTDLRYVSVCGSEGMLNSSQLKVHRVQIEDSQLVPPSVQKSKSQFCFPIDPLLILLFSLSFVLV